jgi:hypothetical protein
VVDWLYRGNASELGKNDGLKGQMYSIVMYLSHGLDPYCAAQSLSPYTLTHMNPAALTGAGFSEMLVFSTIVLSRSRGEQPEVSDPSSTKVR